MLEAPGRRHSIPPWGHEHIDDLPELVDRAVDVAPPLGDLHRGPVDMPAAADGVPAGPGGRGRQRRESQHPAGDRHVVDLDAAFGEQLLDVTVGETEPQVPPHGRAR